MKKLIFLFIILISLIIPCYGQDQTINGRNSNITFDVSLPWSSLATRTYILAPLGPDYGFCISMINNNTTSSHTFAVAVFQSGDLNVPDYTHFTGRYAPLAVVGAPSPIIANSTQTFFVRSNGASKLAFQFTGASTQAGAPDTVDIYGVQTTAQGCGTVNPQTGQQYTLATPNTGTSAASPIMAISDGLQQSFWSGGRFVNPAASQDLQVVTNNAATIKNIYFDHVEVTCSAACDLALVNIVDAGSLCTSNQGSNQFFQSGITTISTGRFTCTTHPTQAGTIIPIEFGTAGGVTTIDIKGFIAPKNTTTGLELYAFSAVVGTVGVSFHWYEK